MRSRACQMKNVHISSRFSRRPYASNITTLYIAARRKTLTRLTLFAAPLTQLLQNASDIGALLLRKILYYACDSGDQVHAFFIVVVCAAAKIEHVVLFRSRIAFRHARNRRRTRSGKDTKHTYTHAQHANFDGHGRAEKPITLSVCVLCQYSQSHIVRRAHARALRCEEMAPNWFLISLKTCAATMCHVYAPCGIANRPPQGPCNYAGVHNWMANWKTIGSFLADGARRSPMQNGDVITFNAFDIIADTSIIIIVISYIHIHEQ